MFGSSQTSVQRQCPFLSRWSDYLFFLVHGCPNERLYAVFPGVDYMQHQQILFLAEYQGPYFGCINCLEPVGSLTEKTSLLLQLKGELSSCHIYFIWSSTRSLQCTAWVGLSYMVAGCIDSAVHIRKGCVGSIAWACPGLAHSFTGFSELPWRIQVYRDAG